MQPPSDTKKCSKAAACVTFVHAGVCAHVEIYRSCVVSNWRLRILLFCKKGKRRENPASVPQKQNRKKCKDSCNFCQQFWGQLYLKIAVVTQRILSPCQPFCWDNSRFLRAMGKERAPCFLLLHDFFVLCCCFLKVTALKKTFCIVALLSLHLTQPRCSSSQMSPWQHRQPCYRRVTLLTVGPPDLMCNLTLAGE